MDWWKIINQAWDDHKEIVLTVLGTIACCAMVDAAYKSQSGRQAINGLLVTTGTQVVTSLSEKLRDNAKEEPQDITLSKEEYEILKKEVELARRKERIASASKNIPI